MELQNPFLISGYGGPAYFCDREKETEKIREALTNGRNLTLLSLRRMGKTGLIEHVFHLMKQEPRTRTFYVDLLPTESLQGFIREFSRATLGKLDSTPTRIMKHVGTALSTLRPVIAYDSISGEPSVTFEMRDLGTEHTTLEQIFQYLDNHNKKIIIALDEFQQITNYPEQNTEALLRSFIQKSKNVSFIFSGSRKHILDAMFKHPARPFYQSTDMINLESIDAEVYIAFIIKKFKIGGKEITKEVVEQLLSWARTHTWYVQYICNRLYSLPIKSITLQDFQNLLITILNESQVTWYNYRNLLTSYQWQLLSAIAKQKEVSAPTSKEFINAYHLGTPSSVKTALDALLSKEMIFRDNGKYFVYDVFLSRWLERN